MEHKGKGPSKRPEKGRFDGMKEKTTEIVVQRIEGYSDFSLGSMHVDGKLVAWTLEDEHRPLSEKVMGETRIPAGRYEVTLRTVGGIHQRYSQKFNWHKGTLWIREIPGFKYVLIHIGNNDEHTAGCILVGDTVNIGKNHISSSTVAYTRLCREYIYPAFERGEKVFITVKDEVE